MPVYADVFALIAAVAAAFSIRLLPRLAARHVLITPPAMPLRFSRAYAGFLFSPLRYYARQ